MIINPILPIPLMIVICVVLLLFFRRKVWRIILQVLMVAILFIINLRPMIETDGAIVATTDTDVLFVVDNTISMLAEDYNGTGRRIDAVKEDCKHIMELLPGARYSVISFGNDARRVIPYTNDAGLAEQAIKTLNGQSQYYATGTNMSVAIPVMKEALAVKDTTTRIVFFISDGEITDKKPLQSFAELAPLIDGGAVLGYGTEEGGPMKVTAFVGDTSGGEYLEVLEGYEYVPAKSKIDEETLQKISGELGVDYIHMQTSEDADMLIEGLKSIEGLLDGDGTTTTKGYADIYFYFLIPLIILFLVDYIFYKRKL